MPSLAPQEAEVLARKSMQDFVDACGCLSTEDVGDVLMLMVSTCGVGMAAAVGYREATSRLRAAADFIDATGPVVNRNAARPH